MPPHRYWLWIIALDSTKQLAATKAAKAEETWLAKYHDQQPAPLPVESWEKMEQVPNGDQDQFMVTRKLMFMVNHLPDIYDGDDRSNLLFVTGEPVL